MIRNRLGLPARFLMVATAVACWIPCVPAAAAGMPLVQEPPPPTNLEATLEGTSVRLTWRASVPLPGESPVTGYRIRMYHRPELTTWMEVEDNTGTTALTYLHTTPPRGTTVHYQVAAINAAGTPGNYSNTADVTTTGTGTTGAAPNLRAVPGPASITLYWNRPETGGNTITGYQVDWSANGAAPWTPLRTTISTVFQYQHSGLPPGTTRYYRVRALYSDGNYGPAGRANARTLTTGIPGVPRNLTARADGPSVILNWDAPSSNGGSTITGYDVRVSADNAFTSSQTVTLTGDQTSYRHTGLTAGTTRYYRVRARNAAGEGDWTSTVSAITSAGTPGPPRDLTANADGAEAIELDWRAPSDAGSAAVTGYRIEASANGVIWSVLERNHQNTDYRDEDLPPGTTRHYRVAAINRHGQGSGRTRRRPRRAARRGDRRASRPGPGDRRRSSWTGPPPRTGARSPATGSSGRAPEPAGGRGA